MPFDALSVATQIHAAHDQFARLRTQRDEALEVAAGLYQSATPAEWEAAAAAAGGGALPLGSTLR